LNQGVKKANKMHITYEKLTIDENNIVHCYEFIQQRFTSPFHLHDEFELIVIVKSHGKVYVGSTVSNFNDGDVFFFVPGIPHCFYNSIGYEKEGINAHAVVIQFKNDFLGTDFLEKNETVALKKFMKKSESGIHIINPSKDLVNRIINLNQKKNLEKIIELLSILNELSVKKTIKMLSSGINVTATSLYDSKIINDVYKYVAENFQNEISFSEASSIANMQRAAFCRYFKRKTKKKFTDFVNETRIMHAQKLLAETDKIMQEIAFDCGYTNTSYFNRQFRKYCNVTPIEFKKLITIG
jgi:AraC-like DNA-binding protein